MRPKSLSAALCCLLAAVCLSGCASILDHTYSTVEEHSGKYWESEAAGTLRAETYQDIVNDILLLIGRHTTDAEIRLYDYGDDATVAETLEKAATEVQQETPMGAYAVEYITTESRSQRGYYEVTLHLSYRRTADQIRSVVNVTSAAALPDLLSAALDQKKTELAVRIGYWGEDQRSEVDEIVEKVREEHGLSDTPAWTISCYPQTGDVGLIEFEMSGEAQRKDTGKTESKG
ncbi:MAG: hypothetical protein LKJ80_04745 [Oscillibacter sp.]|jgi:1-aminocyclopropane-1-carboxylate deaminase/D-cysteine desulfhydrase-like pyridoxal-dependent ACC family enzyme|nr:hypothetical protein [Oscillibacter sp.]